MKAAWGATEWISQNTPAGEPCPLVQDSRFVGWACGGTNAVKARGFLKSAMEPRSIWAGMFAEGGDVSLADLAKGFSGDGDDAGALD